MRLLMLTPLVILTAPAYAGTTVISIETEGNGIVAKATGETNPDGAMAWSGTEWIVNSTYGHMYFVDTQTRIRLKDYTTTLFQGSQPETVSPPSTNYSLTRSLYSYQKTVTGGVYSFNAVQYRVRNMVTGREVVLRSRGTGTGTANPYFDIYIQDDTASGNQVTAMRGDPVWFTYVGTIDQALLQTSPTTGKTGDLPTAGGNYFLDVDGGSDMGGWSHQFHTAALPVATPALSLGSVFAIDYSLKWPDASLDLHELRFLPWAEGTYTGNPTPLATVSAASFAPAVPLAAEVIAAGYGQNLVPTVEIAPATGPLPTILADTSVNVRDSAGADRTAPLWFVSPSQINYYIPEGTVLGQATVTVVRQSQTIATGTLQIEQVAPGLFTMNANGQGVPAALAIFSKGDRTQTWQYVFNTGCLVGSCQPIPIDLGPATDQVYLQLYGTGIRGRSGLGAVTATIGGVAAPVEYAGPVAGMSGLDQVNLRVPRSLIGRGEVDIVLTMDGKTANTVRVNIK